MKKVKFIRNESVSKRITPGKVYDVIAYIPMLHNIEDCVYVINDFGLKDSFYKHIVKSDGVTITLGDRVFIDVTAEFRDEVIDEILL